MCQEMIGMIGILRIKGVMAIEVRIWWIGGGCGDD